MNSSTVALAKKNLDDWTEVTVELWRALCLSDYECRDYWKRFECDLSGESKDSEMIFIRFSNVATLVKSRS